MPERGRHSGLGPPEHAIQLRILALSDLHANLRAYDYCMDEKLETVGLTRLATLIRDARGEVANCLLFDNGDTLQGNSLGEFVAKQYVGENPIIGALNRIGTDAATVGNHDFNFGLPYLERAIADAQYPVVCANLLRERGATPDGDQTLLPPYCILERSFVDLVGMSHDLRIGVIGLSPPQTVSWEGCQLDGALTAREVLDSAKHHLPRLRAEGVDLIVCLAHGGLGIDPRAEGPENVSLRLAEMPEVDVIIMGHVHDIFPDPDPAKAPNHPAVDPRAGTVAGKPAVMPGHCGANLGVIDLGLRRDAETGRWTVASSQSSNRTTFRRDPEGRAIPLVAKDPEMERLTRPVHLQTLNHIRQIVSFTPRPLMSYFTMIGRDPALETITAAMKHFLQTRLQGSRYAHLPVLAAAAQLRSGGRAGPEYFTDVKAGDIALRDLADLYPFPDRLHALVVTGAELRAWLEVSAASYNHVPRGGRDVILLDNAVPGYLRDTIAGLNYRIDLTRPSAARGGRIVDLTFEGEPVRDEQEFVVAANNYRASGGGGVPGTGPNRSVMTFPDLIPDIVRSYLEAGPLVAPDPTWQFAPICNTSILFQTGAGALDYPEVFQGMNLEHCGTDESGFALLRMHL